MIRIRYEYSCDACQRGLGVDSYDKRPDSGAFPVPRVLRIVGNKYVCEDCFAKADKALSKPG